MLPATSSSAATSFASASETLKKRMPVAAFTASMAPVKPRADLKNSRRGNSDLPAISSMLSRTRRPSPPERK